MENHEHVTYGSFDVGKAELSDPKADKQVVMRLNNLRNKLDLLTEAIVILEKDLSPVLALPPSEADETGILNDYVPLAFDLEEQNIIIGKLIHKVQDIIQRLEI